MGNIALNKLTVSRLQEFLIGLNVNNGGKLSDKTVINLKNMLHCAMEQAVLNNIIAKNYLDAVRLPKRNTSEQRVLSIEEQTALIKAAKSYPNEASFSIILDLFTGLRSARAYDRILRVARTIADLEGVDAIEARHIGRACMMRSFEREDWGVTNLNPSKQRN